MKMKNIVSIIGLSAIFAFSNMAYAEISQSKPVPKSKQTTSKNISSNKYSKDTKENKSSEIQSSNPSIASDSASPKEIAQIIYQNLSLKKMSNQEVSADLVNNYVDIERLSRRTLGLQYKSLSVEQKKEFHTAYLIYLKKNIENVLNAYPDFKIDEIKSVENGESANLSTKIAVKQQQPIKLDLQLLNINGWKMMDISFENISLINGYRTQFLSIIKTKGFDVLIENMKK